MKTRIKIFMSAMLLLLSAGMFSGCSNDDFNDFDDLEVKTDVGVESLKEFLSKTFPFGHDFNAYSLIKNCNSLERGKNIGAVINSNEELASIYTGEEKLPTIDFSNISIIMGCVVLPDTGYEYKSINWENNKNETLITVYYKELPTCYPGDTTFYFYKVVPKFEPGKTIRAVVNYIKD